MRGSEWSERNDRMQMMREQSEHELVCLNPSYNDLLLDPMNNRLSVRVSPSFV